MYYVDIIIYNLIGFLCTLMMVGYFVSVVVNWINEAWAYPHETRDPCPTDEDGEVVKEFNSPPALEHVIVSTMAESIAHEEENRIFFEMLYDSDPLSINSDFWLPIRDIDKNSPTAIHVLEAGGPKGDKLVEDCWMRDQLLVSLDDAEDIVGLINGNPGYAAKVDRDNRTIIVTKEDGPC